MSRGSVFFSRFRMASAFLKGFRVLEEEVVEKLDTELAGVEWLEVAGEGCVESAVCCCRFWEEVEAANFWPSSDR